MHQNYRYLTFYCQRTTVALAFSVILAFSGLVTGRAADFVIKSSDRAGQLIWSNAFPAGVVTIETANVVTGRWSVGSNFFTSNSVGGATVSLTPNNTFVRLLAVD